MIPRWLHRVYAAVGGYFWLPCPCCGRKFGGHETGGATLWTEWHGPLSATGKVCCPRCRSDSYADEWSGPIPWYVCEEK